MNYLKLVNAILVLFSLFMGVKHGIGMVTAKTEMLTMFAKWDIGKSGVIALGVIGIGASLMTLFPKTFFAGNFITAVVLLLLTALCLNQRDLKGAFAELPFAVLPLVIIYLQYPFDYLLKFLRNP
jgi:hypothetical protein